MLTYTYNDLDQLQNIQTSDSVIQASYTYDLSGNRASMTSYGNTVTYTYDGQNNMTSSGGVTYTYDAKGERLTKTVGSDTYSYYYNGVNLLFTKKNGETEAQYFYAGDEVYGASGSDATAYWYCTDVRGSVTSIHKGMTDSSTWTELEYSYAYDAYGETTVSEEATTHTLINDIAYTGAILDKETGFYYLMSRYYDPSIGQFISEDSYRGEGDAFWHLYKYCDNDPINKTDRNGEYGAWVATKRNLRNNAKNNTGNAQSFVYCKKMYPKANCVGYAFGKNKIIFLSIPKKYHNVKSWFPSLTKCARNNNRWIRLLTSRTSPIFPNERRVAFRCYTKDHTVIQGGIEYTTRYAYHLMRQVNSGCWSDRNGNGEFRNNTYNPNLTDNWPRAGSGSGVKLNAYQKEKSLYDSPTLYFAISLKKYKA